MTRVRGALVASAALLLAGCHPSLAQGPTGGTGRAKPETDLRTVLTPRLHASPPAATPPDERPPTGGLPEGAVPDPNANEIRTEEDIPNDIAEADNDGDGDGDKMKEDERAGDDGADGIEDKRKASPRTATASTLGGKLSADQVNAVIDANFERLSSCSSSEAIVSVRATVSTECRVIEASAVRSTPDDPRIRDCIASTFKTLEFPRIVSEWPTRLSFDLRVGGS